MRFKEGGRQRRKTAVGGHAAGGYEGWNWGGGGMSDYSDLRGQILPVFLQEPEGIGVDGGDLGVAADDSGQRSQGCDGRRDDFGEQWRLPSADQRHEVTEPRDVTRLRSGHRESDPPPEGIADRVESTVSPHHPLAPI